MDDVKLTSLNWPFPIVNGLPIPKGIRRVVFPLVYEEAPW